MARYKYRTQEECDAMTEATTMTELLDRLPPPKALTIAEKLHHIAQMSEQDPTDLHRIAWRLDFLREEIRDRLNASDAALIDAICRLQPSHVNNRSE